MLSSRTYGMEPNRRTDTIKIGTPSLSIHGYGTSPWRFPCTHADVVYRHESPVYHMQIKMTSKWFAPSRSFRKIFEYIQIGMCFHCSCFKSWQGLVKPSLCQESTRFSRLLCAGCYAQPQLVSIHVDNVSRDYFQIYITCILSIYDTITIT